MLGAFVTGFTFGIFTGLMIVYMLMENYYTNKVYKNNDRYCSVSRNGIHSFGLWTDAKPLESKLVGFSQHRTCTLCNLTQKKTV